jgi:hypothetical protein
MAKLTISEAARVAHVARSTLHRAINQGRLSLGSDGTVDTAELLRLGYTLHPVSQQERNRSRRHATPDTPVAQHEESSRLSLLEQERDLLKREHGLLQRELDAALQREQESVTREREGREREGRLLSLLEQMQARFDRLLPPPTPTAASTPIRSHWPADIRERILEHMRQNPGSHTPQDVKDALALPRTPRHIMRHLTDTGRLTRVAPGRYAYPDDRL